MDFAELTKKYKFFAKNGTVNSRFKDCVYPLFTDDEIQIYDAAIGLDCTEKIYCMRNNITSIPTCKQCGNPIRFDKQINRYREYCSNSCRGKGELATRVVPLGAHYPEILQKMRDTCQDRYGEISFSKTEDFKQKVRSKQLTKSLKRLATISSTVIVKRFSTVWDSADCYCENCGADFSHTFGAPGLKNIPLCPNCTKLHRGKDEQAILDWLYTEFPGEIIQEDTRKIIRPKELDIYFPNRNFAIEVDELFWHCEINALDNSSSGRNRQYHLDKTKACEKQGIDLIHVWNIEWRYKQDIVKSLIRSRLGKNISIYARDCVCVSIPTNIAKPFFEQNHIQGFAGGLYKYGLYQNNELVSALIVSSQKFKPGQLEIVRFVTKQNYRVIGGFSKLWAYFLQRHIPYTRIVSYADLRYFTGRVNKQVGFRLDKVNAPSYFYTKNYRTAYHRMHFTKRHIQENSELVFNSELTEWENMRLNNYNRIWDCGQNVWVLDATAP